MHITSTKIIEKPLENNEENPESCENDFRDFVV